MKTKIIKLLSGVECEFSKLTGKHQRLFSQSEYTKDGKGMNMAIADVVVRLGSLNGITEEQASKLLSEDRKQLMMELRDFTLTRNKTFKFDWKFENKEGVYEKVEQEIEASIEDFTQLPYKQQFEEYTEIWEKVETHSYASVTLEDGGVEVFFHPVTAQDELKMSKIPKKKRSSHSIIQARNPKYMITSEDDKNGDVTPVNVRLDDLSYDDIEDLRTAIKTEEGYQDTKALFQNPETEQEEEIDLLTVQAFFFPSNAL